MTDVKVKAAKGVTVCYQHTDDRIPDSEPVEVVLTGYYRSAILGGSLIDVDGIIATDKNDDLASGAPSKADGPDKADTSKKTAKGKGKK